MNELEQKEAESIATKDQFSEMVFNLEKNTENLEFVKTGLINVIVNSTQTLFNSDPYAASEIIDSLYKFVNENIKAKSDEMASIRNDFIASHKESVPDKFEFQD